MMVFKTIVGYLGKYWYVLVILTMGTVLVYQHFSAPDIQDTIDAIRAEKTAEIKVLNDANTKLQAGLAEIREKHEAQMKQIEEEHNQALAKVEKQKQDLVAKFIQEDPEKMVEVWNEIFGTSTYRPDAPVVP